LPSRNIGIRAISTSKPTALASAGGVTSVSQDTGLVDRPARREVLLPSQEKPKNVVDYALFALPFHIRPPGATTTRDG